MAYPFGPQTPTVISDTGRLLPVDAYYKINMAVLNKEPDTQELLTYCRVLLNKVSEAEAKLVAVNKANSNYRRMFEMWKPHIARLKKSGG
jgi:hypothetical protein